jgi:uncharacterized protein
MFRKEVISLETKKVLHMVAFILLIVGGLNWGLFGLFGWDLIEILFGGLPTIADLLYILVGVSAVYIAVTHRSDCKVCSAAK